MQRVLSTAIVLGLAYFGWHHLDLESRFFGEASATDHVLAEAFRDGVSDLQVEGTGNVIRILPDDNHGGRHQRFIVRLQSGQTLLVAHNIDLAPRIPVLRKGDTVSFNGEYEWNSRGGVIHWTHKDPYAGHPSGWLRHKGRTYQ